jgi:hypothetical protein
MSEKHRIMQRIIEEWQAKTGNDEIDMKEVAAYAISKGWRPPAPLTAEERLAKEFSQAAREATKEDEETGQTYRVYHAVKMDGQGQGVFWVNIDSAPRKHMVKSAFARREQAVGDLVQLTLDLNHWNRINPAEEPIMAEGDLTPDIAERLAGGDN